MIRAEELRIGNRIFWNTGFSSSKILVQVEVVSIAHDKVGFLRSHFEHRVEPFEDDVIATENIIYASSEELEPITLTKEVLDKLDLNIRYSEWIQSLHELQNWYYYTYKKELELPD